MHSDHHVFLRGISQSKKLKVTLLSDEDQSQRVCTCGPLYYSKGNPETEESGCYYLWDFDAAEGYSFVAAPPSKIVKMELTDDAFAFGQVSSLSKGPHKSTNHAGSDR